jgi:hypothetical protein
LVAVGAYVEVQLRKLRFREDLNERKVERAKEELGEAHEVLKRVPSIIGQQRQECVVVYDHGCDGEVTGGEILLWGLCLRLFDSRASHLSFPSQQAILF